MRVVLIRIGSPKFKGAQKSVNPCVLDSINHDDSGRVFGMALQSYENQDQAILSSVFLVR